MKDLQKVKEALDEFERTEPGHVDLINDARKELAELEKPVDEDLVNIAARWVGNETDIALLACDIEQYAVQRCHICPKLKTALDTHIRDRDAEIERIAEKE